MNCRIVASFGEMRGYKFQWNIPWLSFDGNPFRYFRANPLNIGAEFYGRACVCRFKCW